jgi:3-methyladenine DNA glycosylase Tag
MLRKSQPVDNGPTRLNKRENFRRAFAEFDLENVARFGKRETNRLMQDAGMVNDHTVDCFRHKECARLK